jgi:hypothetical protein
MSVSAGGLRRVSPELSVVVVCLEAAATVVTSYGKVGLQGKRSGGSSRVYIHAGFVGVYRHFLGCQAQMEEKMKYYWYYYTLNGAPCSGKRISTAPQTPQTIQEHEITEEEFTNASFTQLAYKYPFKGIPDLT